MLIFKRSQVVISIVLLNLILIDCKITKVNSHSLSHIYKSPTRIANSNNGFVVARTNQMDINSQNSQTNGVSSRINSTNENLQSYNASNNKASEQDHQSANFTTDDVQTLITNDKSSESNLTLNNDIKPIDDSLVNKESTNKNIANDPAYYSNGSDQFIKDQNSGADPDNQMVQVDTFNNENLAYSNNENFCFICNSQVEMFNSNQMSKCCDVGYTECCNKLTNNQKDVNGNQVNQSSFINSIVNPDPNTVTNVIINSNLANNLAGKNVQLASNTDSYGTKNKNHIKSPGIKIKEQQSSTDQNLDKKQSISVYNSSTPNQLIYGFTTPFLNSYLVKDKLILPSAPNSNYLASYLLNNFNNLNPNLYSNLNPNLYSNLNPNLYSNLSPNLYSNLSPNLYSNLNPNLLPSVSNQINSLNTNATTQLNNPVNTVVSSNDDLFSRKTSNRSGTKTALKASITNSNPIGESTINQPVNVDQNKQSVQNNENNLSIQSMNSVYQSQTTSQRVNNRNPNVSNPQQQTQGSKPNVFSSFISHIPFIGFNPISQIPVFGFSSSNSQNQQQQQSQLNNPQILPASVDGQIVGSQNFPYATVFAIRPPSQNAQLTDPNQIPNSNNQLQMKGTNLNQQSSTNQQLSTNQQSSTNQLSNTGFVSAIFSRPYTIAQRIGGYFNKPSFFGSNKPTTFLHYANNQLVPLELLQPELLNDPNLQNLQNLQFYSQLINSNPNLLNQNNYENFGQVNPPLINHLQNNEKQQSRRS